MSVIAQTSNVFLLLTVKQLPTKPILRYKKEYTVQQALFCTSGIVTSIPVPLAESALLHTVFLLIGIRQSLIHHVIVI